MTTMTTALVLVIHLASGLDVMQVVEPKMDLLACYDARDQYRPIVYGRAGEKALDVRLECLDDVELTASSEQTR